MKISKLFHWLYAIVMLLPVFAIASTCLYAIFNKNAKDSYYGENVNEYTTLNTNLFDLKEGQNYTFLNTLVDVQESGFVTVSNNIYIHDFVNIQNVNVTSEPDHFTINFSGQGYARIRFYYQNDQVSEYYYLNNNFYSFSFTFDELIGNYNEDLLSNFNWYSYKIYNEYSFVSDSFYYAVNKVTQSPLFNWAYNSFLVTPFAYIVNLFSMPTNSPIVMLLSYWLAISIIWLVFDLIMYVPLLTHRWIDKGMIE